MPFPRGARRSPPHKLLAAVPYQPVAPPPAEFAIVPPKLSYWDNERDGVCVSSEEAFAKAAWSVYCGLAEVFASEQEVRDFAAHHGWLNGATLTEVMDVMIAQGMAISGTVYKDGSYSGVDYTRTEVLQSAIATGPVKIAIDADALPGSAGNESGWFAFGPGHHPNTDHCVALTGYGTAKFCFDQLGVPVPGHIDPSKPDCYLLFTWNTIGVVDQDWLLGTCTEAWVRHPTTPGQSPTPPPPPPPPQPPVHPDLVVNLTGKVAGFLPVHLTGTAAPAVSAVALPNLLVILNDLLSIAADYKVGDYTALVRDVQKLLADLGLKL